MSELRWHPLLREWVVTATHRQDRTFLPPADHCPFCPPALGGTPTEVPHGDWDVAVFENRFPALRADPEALAVSGLDVAPVAPAEGICEVVLYTPRHDGSLADLDLASVEHLIEVWADRTRSLGEQAAVSYVYVFENRGEEVGVTLAHPHGQIYAFPFVPPRPLQEVRAVEEHLDRTRRCLLCELVAEEGRRRARVVFELENWVTVAPFYSRYPYELQVIPKPHRGTLMDLLAGERRELADSLRRIVRGYDRLWNVPVPYMMAIGQRPTDGRRYDGFHLHVDFLPIRRSRDRLKYVASVESGAGVFLTDVLPEQAAERLRPLMGDGAGDTG